MLQRKKPEPPAAATATEAVLDPCTEDEAYTACVETNEKMAKPVPDEVLDDYWMTAVGEIAKDDKNITNEEHAQIRAAVMVSLNIPF